MSRESSYNIKEKKNEWDKKVNKRENNIQILIHFWDEKEIYSLSLIYKYYTHYLWNVSNCNNSEKKNLEQYFFSTMLIFKICNY